MKRSPSEFKLFNMQNKNSISTPLSFIKVSVIVVLLRTESLKTKMFQSSN